MIPVYEPYLVGNEKKYVNECLDSTWISSRGEFIDRFEKEFSRYIGVEFATAVFNGTVALHLAMEALGFDKGDEVIVPTFTYIASVNTIKQAGATPVFVDSLESTLQIDPASIRSKITSRTKAIMAVHLYGHPCEMDEIVQICNDHDLLLIEDCAEALGTYYKSKHVGTFGDVATFSFFGNKTITTGEGGMVVCKSRDVIERLRHLKNQGVSNQREYWHDAYAFNYRMTNIQAAIGCAQLESLDEILQKKQEIANWYMRGLEGLPVRLHDAVGDVVHSYWMCSVIMENGEDNVKIRSYLKSNGVDTRPFFIPAHIMPVFKSEEKYPVAEKISRSGMNMPSFPGLNESVVEQICHTIQQFLATIK